MVNESAPDPHILDIIQNTIASKAWYSLSPTGGYNWPASVGNMTESLQSELKWDQPDLFTTVRQALENAFTPDCLTRIGQELFIDKLSALARSHGNELLVWTVGDVGWQTNKAERTGIFAHGVTRENFRSTEDDKRAGLLDILRDIRAQKPDTGTIHVYVLDDKEENILVIRSMEKDAAGLNIVLHDFYVKDGVKGATPADAYMLLETELEHLGDNVAIVSDFDGVLANTDKALKEQGARNIYHAFVTSQAT